MPTISRPLLIGSKLGSKAPEVPVEKDAFAEAYLELPDLLAERRPWERGVDADDVPARAVAHGFQEIAAGAIDLRQGDEGSPQVMAAAASQPQRVQVLMV